MCVFSFTNRQYGNWLYSKISECVTIALICRRIVVSSDTEENIKACRKHSTLLHAHAVATAKWLSEAKLS